MALQFILGNSGSGKTEYAYRQVVKEAGEHPKRNYLVIVPEQFTMQTQKILVELSPNHAIMNIDVLSFQRLAYRVFDEVGCANLRILEETGKNLVLRKVAQEKEEELTVLRSNMNRMGYVEELKSLLCEFVAYNIGPKQLREYLDKNQVAPSFRAKLTDIITMYEGFTDYMEGNYITAEEILNVLISVADKSKILADAVMVFDEFTGFTPIQNLLLEKLLPMTSDLRVILTMDAKENPYVCRGEHECFYMTKKTIASLSKMADETGVRVLEPVVLSDSRNHRFKNASDLAFLEENLFRSSYKKMREEVTNITLTSLKNPREELLFVAREITRLVREENYRYRDIAIVTGQSDTYANYMEDIFGKYQIPVFLDQTNELMFHPFVEAMRALLEILQENFSYESMMRFLRTGFSGIEEEDVDTMDNYLYAFGIRGRKSWEAHFTRNTAKETYDVFYLNGLRSDLMELLAPLLALKSKNTGAEYILALYKTFVAMQAEARLIALAKEYQQNGFEVKMKQYEQVYPAVMALLEKFYALLGEEVLTLEEFMEILDAGLSATKIAVIPPRQDSVTLADIERSRLSGIKVLFFVGVNDGIIPKAATAGGIISEYERQQLTSGELELAPGVREQAFVQRFYLYRNVTKPSDKLYLTYARVDNIGQAMLPSYFVKTIQQIFPTLIQNEIEDIKTQKSFATLEAALDYLVFGTRDKDWYALAKCYLEMDEERAQELLLAPFTSYTKEMLTKELAEKLYGSNLISSVTRMEKFASCAYAHFLSYGLGLKERMEAGFAGLEMGNVYHHALESYSKALNASEYDWFNVPDTLRQEMAREAFYHALESEGAVVAYANGEESHTFLRMERIFDENVWALTKQVRAGKFVPAQYELSFAGTEQMKALTIPISEDNAMHLIGRIDRLDLCREEDKLYLKVIDYKSGSKTLDLADIYEGLSLQLVTYLNAAEEVMRKKHKDALTLVPGGILYYQITDPVVEVDKEEDVEEAVLKELRPTGLINSAPEVLEAFDEAHYHGVGKTSLVAKFEITKSGFPSKKSQVTSQENFDTLKEYVGNKLRENGTRIYDGDIAVSPYKKKEATSCDYCPYACVCKREKAIKGYTYRNLDITKEEALDRMRTENAMVKDGKKL